MLKNVNGLKTSLCLQKSSTGHLKMKNKIQLYAVCKKHSKYKHTNRLKSKKVEKEAMASHSSTLAWKIPWMEEPGRLQFMGSLRVEHDWTTSLSLFTFMHWRRKWQPTPVFLPGESWWAAVYGVTQSRTRLKWLSNSNSNSNMNIRK